MSNDLRYKECEYFLIRLAPDPIRNEFLNIGVALFDRAGFADVRVLRDYRRVECLFPTFDLGDIAQLQDVLQQVLQHPGEPAFDRLLHDAAESFSLALQFTEPKGVLTTAPEKELETLYDQYVRPPQAPEREVRADSRFGIREQLKGIFEAERVMATMRERVRFGDLPRGAQYADPFRFDFHYVAQAEPHAPDGFVHVLRLGRGETAAAKELGFTVRDLRQFRPEVRVTAVVNDPEEALDRADDRRFEQRSLVESGVTVEPISRGIELARNIRRQCGFA